MQLHSNAATQFSARAWLLYYNNYLHNHGVITIDRYQHMVRLINDRYCTAVSRPSVS